MALSVGSLFTFIIVMLACGLLVWLAFYVVEQFQPPEPVGKIIRVVVVVIAVLVIVALLLNFAGVGPGVRITGMAAPVVVA
jgi:hypothetical protein